MVLLIPPTQSRKTNCNYLTMVVLVAGAAAVVVVAIVVVVVAAVVVVVKRLYVTRHVPTYLLIIEALFMFIQSESVNPDIVYPTIPPSDTYCP